jgi:hypothetical protein
MFDDQMNEVEVNDEEERHEEEIAGGEQEEFWDEENLHQEKDELMKTIVMEATLNPHS